ncbi:hypothetical protein QBC44DRAFT_403123 [Cladorrhinum sp. PSN332]|nr:hypothetical protein QBC44DRAFT_403123 [Cladorrhinum sp. PSN332]
MPSSSPLLNVPAEIIHNICEKIINSAECVQSGNYAPPGCPIKEAPWWFALPGYPALINLRLACTSLAAIAEPFMYQRLHLQFRDPSKNEAALKKLTRHPELASRIKRLAVSTWYQKGDKFDGSYLLGEAARLKCQVPVGAMSDLKAGVKDIWAWGEMLQALTIDLAMVHAPGIEELVLYYDNEDLQLGRWVPGGFELGSLRHVKIYVGQNWESESLLFRNFLPWCTPKLETLLIQRYKMTAEDYECLFWAPCDNLRALDLDEIICISPQEVAGIVEAAPLLESFRCTWHWDHLQSQIPTTPCNILEGLYPLRETLRHLDLDLMLLTQAEEPREDFNLLPEFTGLHRLQINFRGAFNTPKTYSDSKFLVECLPPNIKTLSLLRMTYSLDDSMEELAQAIKAGRFPALKEIWFPKNWQDPGESDAEAVEKFFEGTDVSVRENDWDGQMWYLDYISRDVPDDSDDSDDEMEEGDGED